VTTAGSIGHLASSVGHHLINAFSAVVSNTEILRMRLTGDSAEDPSVLAESIIRTSLEASHVARRLIDVSRTLTDIGSENIRLDQLVGDYVRERSAQVSDKVFPKINWQKDLRSVPPILGNASDLRCLFDHLTLNSVEAAEQQAELLIGFTLSIDSRGWLVLEIRDNAPGMSHEVLERAVEPFFTTKPHHFGVGLSLANGIWRRHKGTLSLRSMSHEGTTVRLCIEPLRNP
jgi:signal transduction histidine kinase